MTRIRSGMGLGDAIYLQSIARHLIDRGEAVTACTAWPDVFLPLAGRIGLAPFSRQNIQRLAHYSLRKGVAGTTQFQDMCIQAGIDEPVELRLDWNLLNVDLIARLRDEADARPIICVQLPRSPMGRTDGFGAELLPDCSVIQRLIDVIKDHALLVQVGQGAALHEFDGIHLDLANNTSITDLIDVASVAHGFIGYPSFIVPLAESLNKPALLVWSRRGLTVRTGRQPQFIRQITPEKVLHKNTSLHVIDDWNIEQIMGVLREFLDSL